MQVGVHGDRRGSPHEEPPLQADTDTQSALPCPSQDTADGDTAAGDLMSTDMYCSYYVCVYVYMYPDAFSINYKSADRSTFAMYWGTFVMYPSFWKWH